MKSLLTAVLILVTSVTAFSQNKIEGMWSSDDNKREVEITKTSTGYTGIIRKDEDKNNVGKTLISALKDDGEGKYKDGTVHPVKMNTTAKCTAKMLDDKTLEIKISKGIISKTIKWKKIN